MLGNESEIYKQKLEVTVGQELEVTKDIVNPKAEYKIGDIVTYSVKVKIKENEFNKGKMDRVDIEDIFPEDHLE